MLEFASPDFLHAACLSALLLSLLSLSLWVRSVEVQDAPLLGHKGLSRARAIEGGGLFSRCEPLVRFMAGVVRPLPLKALRAWQEKKLLQADHYLGLTPDEWTGMSVLSAGALGAAVFGLAATVEVGILHRSISVALWIGGGGFVVGACLPAMQVSDEVRGRTKSINRGLPQAIEVAAMCMSAGMDFPGAVRQIVAASKSEETPLHRELAVILERLGLGHTRGAALLGFAERVPSEAVRDFVNAVVQAEKKGNPLAQVIQVQGRILNMRRSVAAEEAAARAGVLMIVPMMLLVMCIMLLLVGPFLVTGAGF